MTDRPIEDDDAWSDLRAQWTFGPAVSYLNHGSFGPSPRAVIEARRHWQAELEANPMEFYTRRLDRALASARERLGRFIGCAGDDLIFVDNATFGMNIVAESVPLRPGDEVLLNDHEYGAVRRIWERRCRRTGATLVTQTLPVPFESAEQVIEQLLSGVSPRTRILVVSHVTNPTAIVMPIVEICRRARALGLTICVDGPHAPAMVDVDLAQIDCDFYAASCHKWLAAPFGSGFLYVHPRHQSRIEPVIVSWGRAYPPDLAPAWHNEFTWIGTRDPSAFLTIPTAIEFIETVGLESFRARTHFLARYARRRIGELTGLDALTPDDRAWYGSMISLPLAGGNGPALQERLWREHGIEIPLPEWSGRLLIRPSCHLYTTQAEIDALVSALDHSD